MNHIFSQGDQVVVDRYEFGVQYRLGTVEAVTPTGQIRLTERSRFLPNGWRIGEGREHILPATDGNLAKYREQQLRANIRQQVSALTTRLGGMKLPELERALKALCVATGEVNAEARESMSVRD
jgi:hypothetical protein